MTGRDAGIRRPSRLGGAAFLAEAAGDPGRLAAAGAVSLALHIGFIGMAASVLRRPTPITAPSTVADPARITVRLAEPAPAATPPDRHAAARRPPAQPGTAHATAKPQVAPPPPATVEAESVQAGDLSAGAEPAAVTGIAVAPAALPSHPSRRRFFGRGLGDKDGAPHGRAAAEMSRELEQQARYRETLAMLFQQLQRGLADGPGIRCELQPVPVCEPRAQREEALINGILGAQPAPAGAGQLVRQDGIWRVESGQ